MRRILFAICTLDTSFEPQLLHGPTVVYHSEPTVGPPYEYMLTPYMITNMHTRSHFYMHWSVDDNGEPSSSWHQIHKEEVVFPTLQSPPWTDFHANWLTDGYCYGGSTYLIVILHNILHNFMQFTCSHHKILAIEVPCFCISASLYMALRLWAYFI